jgi:hypothetical protein
VPTEPTPLAGPGPGPKPKQKPSGPGIAPLSLAQSYGAHLSDFWNRSIAPGLKNMGTVAGQMGNLAKTVGEGMYKSEPFTPLPGTDMERDLRAAGKKHDLLGVALNAGVPGTGMVQIGDQELERALGPAITKFLASKGAGIHETESPEEYANVVADASKTLGLPVPHRINSTGITVRLPGKSVPSAYLRPRSDMVSSFPYTLAHEGGHVTSELAGATGEHKLLWPPDLVRLWQNSAARSAGPAGTTKPRFPTRYAGQDPDEMLAEAFAHYLGYKKGNEEPPGGLSASTFLRRVHPPLYDYTQKYLSGISPELATPPKTLANKYINWYWNNLLSHRSMQNAEPPIDRDNFNPTIDPQEWENLVHQTTLGGQ